MILYDVAGLIRVIAIAPAIIQLIIMEIKEFIEKFAESVEVSDAEALTPETNFHDLEEWGSMAVLMLMAFYDETFSKELTEEDIRRAKTIQDLYNLAIS